MGTKIFYYNPLKVALTLTNTDRYTDGNPIEFAIDRAPQYRIHGWHNIDSIKRVKIINVMKLFGFDEGEEF